MNLGITDSSTVIVVNAIEVYKNNNKMIMIDAVRCL